MYHCHLPLFTESKSGLVCSSLIESNRNRNLWYVTSMINCVLLLNPEVSPIYYRHFYFSKRKTCLNFYFTILWLTCDYLTQIMLKFPCSRCKFWLLLLTFTTVILINCHIWYIYNNVCFYRGSLLLLTTIFIQSCQTQLFEFLLYFNIFNYYLLHRNKYSLLLENKTKERARWYSR